MLPIGSGSDPQIDRGAVPSIDDAGDHADLSSREGETLGSDKPLVRQPVRPPCPNWDGEIASHEAGYAPYARWRPSCGSLLTETRRK